MKFCRSLAAFELKNAEKSPLRYSDSLFIWTFVLSLYTASSTSVRSVQVWSVNFSHSTSVRSIYVQGDILDLLRIFQGKGSLVTYWLLGANKDVPRSPHREMILPDFQIGRPGGQAGLLLREHHLSNLSLRGSMRGSFRNSPAIMRNGGGHVAHESPVMIRWKKADDELLINGIHA
jgi:hypothetical protein